jgi:hypothetical protein
MRLLGYSIQPLLLAIAFLVMPAGALAKAPALAFTPQSGGAYDYGIVDVGSHADQTFTLTNSGGSASSALTISLTGSPTFTRVGDSCSSASLGPGKACVVTIRYTPTGSGHDTATLAATGSKPGATAAVTLRGTGGVADVEISPASRDFGSVPGSQTFTATNEGNISTGTYAFGGPTDPHFALTGTNTCTGAGLGPNESCSFTIAFGPPTCATHPTLYLDSVSLGSYASATLRGQQPQCLPHLVFDPCHGGTAQAYCLFPFPTIGADVPQVFTLTNDGDISTGSLTFTFTNDPFGTFTLAPPSGSGDCQNVSSLAMGASCTVTVTWAGYPADCTTGQASETAELRVDDDAYDYPPPGFFGGDAELFAWYDC